jgi:hypothetical protein
LYYSYFGHKKNLCKEISEANDSVAREWRQQENEKKKNSLVKKIKI